MSTSGSTNFSLTRNNLVRRAFQAINVYQLKDDIEHDDMMFAVDILNALLKELISTTNLRPSLRKIATLFPIKGTASYTLDSTTSNCTNSYVKTTISSAEALGQTALSVTSSSGMTAGDYVGVELDDGTRQWTTISNVNSSTLITVNSSLTAAAAAGNTVVSYTSKIISKPLLILRATRYDLNHDVEVKVTELSHSDYFDLPNKSIAGNPIQFHLDKNNDSSTLYLYMTPSDVDQVIKFSYYEDIEDFDSVNDELDLPKSWTLAIITALAAELCLPYGKIQELPVFQQEAEKRIMKLSIFDADEESLLLRPARNP
jgi:hypothetical protein